MTEQTTLAWVFLSHASADLQKVREVRNFMEQKGAAPLLFHLRALSKPEEFWPLIKREIAARNFFLLCNSKAALASQWVQREQEAVTAISRQKPIRVGTISVEDKIDFNGLARFLKNLRYYKIGPVSIVNNDIIDEIMRSYGYESIGTTGLSMEGMRRLDDGSQMANDLNSHMEYGAREGWLLVFLDREMEERPNFWSALPSYLTEGRIIFVVLESVSNTRISSHNFVFLENSMEQTVHKAAQMMLTG